MDGFSASLWSIEHLTAPNFNSSANYSIKYKIILTTTAIIIKIVKIKIQFPKNILNIK